MESPHFQFPPVLNIFCFLKPPPPWVFYFDYLPKKLFHGALGIKFHYVNDCCKGTKNTDTHLFLLSASSSELVFLRRDDKRFLLLSKGIYDSSSLSFLGGGGRKILHSSTGFKYQCILVTNWKIDECAPLVVFSLLWSLLKFH